MPDDYVVKSALRASRLINANNRGFLSDVIPSPKSSFTRTITLSEPVSPFLTSIFSDQKESRSILMITREFTRGYRSGAMGNRMARLRTTLGSQDRIRDLADNADNFIFSFSPRIFCSSLAPFRSGKAGERVYWSDEYPLPRRYLHSGDERGKKKRKKGVRIGAPLCRLCVFGL